MLDVCSRLPNTVLLPHRKLHVGIGAARAAMLAYSRQQNVNFIATRDSDDVSIPGAMAYELDALESGASMVGGAMIVREPDGQLRHRPPVQGMSAMLKALRRGQIPCFNPTLMFRLNDIPPEITYRPVMFGEDVLFQAEVIRAGAMVVNVSQTVVLYRRHPASTTASIGKGLRMMATHREISKLLQQLSEEYTPDMRDKAFIYARMAGLTLPSSVRRQVAQILYS